MLDPGTLHWLLRRLVSGWDKLFKSIELLTATLGFQILPSARHPQQLN